MLFSILNRIHIFSLLLLSFYAGYSQNSAHIFVDSLDTQVASFSTFDCNFGLTYKVWNQTGLNSCNAFFGGSPGTAPAGFTDSAGSSNTQYGDFSISPSWNGQDDMIQLKGFIIIPETGNYRFRTFSDDGSRLYINNTLVVDNDGTHAPATVTSGNIFYTAGIYPFECQYFERGGEDILVVSWQTPSSAGFDIMPNEIFIRNASSVCTNFWLNPGKPFTLYSCPKELQDLNLPSGVYLFDPDGDGLNPIKGYYDNGLGGGWLMVLNYVHRGGTDPALNIRTNSLPLLGSSSLGVDESGTQFWGHASNSLLNQFNITEIRFFGVTSSHQRVLHFSTTNANAINYIRTGTGSMNGIQTGFSNYAGSGGGTANLPGSANTFRSNQGDNALTYTPFYNGNYEWEIRRGNDWNMDDRANDEDENTIHRVWIRTTDCAVNTAFYADGDNVDIAESITKGNAESILTQTNGAEQPVFRDNIIDNINFNPVFDIDGNDELISESIIGLENSELTFFIVAKERTRTTNRVVKFKDDESGSNRYFIHFPWTDGNVYWDAGTASAPNRIQGPIANPVGQPSIGCFSNSLSSGIQNINVDGTSVGSDITGHQVLNLDFTTLGKDYNGWIGDFIVIDKLLSNIQIERIESYLAIKYGVTLGHNYYSSLDQEVYNVSNGYGNDIFGVGRDEVHGLYQTRSHTENINTSDILFELTQDVSDHQFLISGHNGGALTRRNLAGESNVLTREWFAEMSGNLGTINIEVDLASIGGNTTPAPSDVKIIIANNPAFNNAYTIEATSITGGIANFEGIPLYDKYYTFVSPP